jgi:hypothetical protein
VNSNLQGICKNLFDEFRGQLTWEWDDWIGTILAKFSTAESAAVRAALDRFLPVVWNSSTMNSAPPIVQTLDRKLGGIRPGQLLFSSDSNQGAFIFCAWWPWADGNTISIRVAPHDAQLTAEDASRLMAELKKFAGI